MKELCKAKETLELPHLEVSKTQLGNLTAALQENTGFHISISPTCLNLNIKFYIIQRCKILHNHYRWRYTLY